MKKTHDFEKDFSVLLEAGFMAVNQADEDAAVKLFRAASLLRPHNTLPKVGFGYLHLCKLELKQASKEFEEVLKAEPENEMAKAFLGFCTSLTPGKLPEGEKILKDSEKHAKDQSVKNLCHDTLDFLEKYLKKPPSPMQLSKETGRHAEHKKDKK